MEFAADVTDALSYGIRKAGVYTFVDPVKLKGIDRSRYHEYVDVFITGEITGVSTDRNVEIRTEKRGDETIEKRYITIITTVSIAYDYIRASNLELLERFKKTETSSTVIERGGGRRESQNRNSHGWNRAWRRMFRNRNPSNGLVWDVIMGFSYSMSQEILPWTSQEKRKIIKGGKEMDPLLQKAAKLVKKKKYSEAYDLY
jgi:hypothetical protein